MASSCSSCWCRPSRAQLDSVDDSRYDWELRPELMRRAIEGAQSFGVEVDICKIEGVDAREAAEMLARQAAPVEGFVGFAVDRSIWWDALRDFLDGDLERRVAAEQVADKYHRFIETYDVAEAAHV